MYIVLLQNAILLLGLGTLYSLISRLDIQNNLLRKILMGCIFGGVAVAGMQVPFHYAPGIIYDGRSIVLTLAGLFGGGIASITAVVIAGTYRAIMGGVGIYAGVATIVGCALAGFLFRRFYKNKPEGLKIMPMYFIGLVAYFVMLAMQMFFLPWPEGVAVVRQIWLPVLIIFPAGTLVMGLFLGNEARRANAVQQLNENKENLRTILNSIGDAVVATDQEDRITGMNPVAEKLSGLSLQEAIGKKFGEIFQKEDRIQENNPSLLPEKSRVSSGIISSVDPRGIKDCYFTESSSPMKDKEGNITGLVRVFRDETEKNLQHRIQELRLELFTFATRHSLLDVLEKTLDEAEKITWSQIGFYHFVEADQETISLQAWSANTKEFYCHLIPERSHYPVAQAGIWADAIRQKRPMIHNDYQGMEGKNGMPEDHAVLHRELVVPVLRENRVVAILGVGNKTKEYTPKDVEVLNFIADVCWEVAEAKRNEEQLRKAAEEWQLTYDNTRDAIFILDNEQRIIRSNMVANDLFHDHGGDIIGKYCWQVVHQSDHPVRGCPILKSRLSLEREGRKLEIGGKWFQVTVDPILNSDGTFNGAVHVMSDITEMHQHNIQLKASERRVKKQRAALAGLITNNLLSEDTRSVDYHKITQALVETLEVAHALILKTLPAENSMQCLSAYHKDLQTWDEGTTFRIDEMPAFYHLIQENFRIKADLDDYPAIGKELASVFSEFDGIQSVIADKIITGGELSGVLLIACTQHRRNWFTDEEAYNGTVASFIAQSFINEERKSIEMERARFGKIFEDSLNEVYLFDTSSLLFKQVNKAALDNLGYTLEELENMTPLDIKPNISRDAYWGLLKPLQDGLLNKTVFETVHRRKNGSLYDVEVHLQLMNLGRESFFTAIINDITQRKITERELRELKDELEIRVAERTAELEEERHKLQLSNQELEAFSYSVSHDLRAPLRAINGFSGYLLQDYAGRLDEDGKRMLDIVYDNANRMDRLILDILNLSRISRAGLSMENLSIPRLAEDVFNNLATAQEKAEFSMSVDPMPQVKGDAVLIRQVLQNLIGNSLKYSSKSDVKKIEITAVEEKDKLNISVRDYGAGFDPEYKSKLFGVFQRLHSDSDFEGTGIGLAIVKRIIHRHGGEVWADGEPGKGAVFSFSLPVSGK